MCQRRQNSLDGGRSVRIIEVFAEMEAEHASETDGHIAVAGKIEVDLQRVANGARPSCQHADLSAGSANTVSAI